MRAARIARLEQKRGEGYSWLAWVLSLLFGVVAILIALWIVRICWCQISIWWTRYKV